MLFLVKSQEKVFKVLKKSQKNFSEKSGKISQLDLWQQCIIQVCKKKLNSGKT